MRSTSAPRILISYSHRDLLLVGEYRKAINRMGRASLGVFRSTPLGIVAAEGGHVPVGPLLNHRQARFAKDSMPDQRMGGGGINPHSERGSLQDTA